MSKSSSNTTEIVGKHIEDLPVPLTDQEIKERSKRQAQVEGELEQHSIHEQNVKAELKATRNRLEAERSKLAAQVRSESEIRPVVVEHIADFVTGIVSEARADTGVVLRQRELHPEERQGTLLSVFGDDDTKGRN